MNKSRLRLTILVLAALSLLSACNMPRRATPTQSGSGLIYTVAAQTVNAQLTQVNQPPGTPFAATFTPPSALPSVTPLSFTPFPTTAPQSASATPTTCDRGAFVKDVNFPDNTRVNPGESFVKTWQIKNVGSCTWTTSYTVVFADGDQMGAPAAQPLTGNVAPGETIDISISLKAPNEPGTYRSDFKLRNANNVSFGLGNQNRPFWVQVRVPGSTSLLFDILAQADVATWTSGAGNEAGTALTFEGAAEDTNGAVKILDGAKLETGATSGKILLMYPRRAENGFVTGLFPVYRVQSGDHFKARIGFIIPSGNKCGSGRVKFQLYYKEGDSGVKLLKEWSKTCNGSLLQVDVDLNSLRGKDVQIALVVFADGSATDDWAIWNSPRIEH